jgi:LuxR family maltose regulon positive regulatory protein
MITPLSNRAPARNDWAKAETLTEQALGIVQAGPLDNLIMSSLVCAVAARTALHRGDVPTARDYLARAARLRPLLTYAIPFLAVQTLLELGRAYLALDDVAGVRAVLWQACEVLRSDPTSASCPLRSRTCGRDWTWTAESAMVHPRSPQPSCACSRCWPPT